MSHYDIREAAHQLRKRFDEVENVAKSELQALVKKIHDLVEGLPDDPGSAESQGVADEAVMIDPAASAEAPIMHTLTVAEMPPQGHAEALGLLGIEAPPAAPVEEAAAEPAADANAPGPDPLAEEPGEDSAPQPQDAVTSVVSADATAANPPPAVVEPDAQFTTSG